MEKSVVLNEIAQKSVRELSLKRLDEIEKELSRLNDLKDEKKALTEFLDQLGENARTYIFDVHYEDSWTWIQKAKYIIALGGNTGKTTREIGEGILSREPDLNRRKAISSLSSVLSTSKDFVVNKNDRNEKTYSLPLMVEDEIEPMEEMQDDDKMSPFRTPLILDKDAQKERSDDLPF